MGKITSLTSVTLVYIVAIAAGGGWLAWGPETRWLWLDGLLADLVATVVVFCGSRVLRNSSCYDPYWSVIPPCLVLYWWFAAADHAGIDDGRATLLLVVVLVWAVRLTANWVQDWPGLRHEDWRYSQLRERAGRAGLLADFVAIHLMPTLIVFAALVPAYAVLARSGRSVNVLDILAVVIGVGAVVVQFVSDAQMRAFIRDRTPGQAMDRGLWAWSRHPNYFGELGFWFSLALFGIAGAPHDWWWLLLGFAAMVAMFQGASIPMMEERSRQRRPAYAEVIARVPRLVPRPPRRPRT
ncbi:MAG: DUF1295 domain-containing protein [Nocardioidaceae bacterium]|nr:DUF1295 domain-containing protein [Nocardioidaceae bacterium]